MSLPESVSVIICLFVCRISLLNAHQSFHICNNCIRRPKVMYVFSCLFVPDVYRGQYAVGQMNRCCRADRMGSGGDYFCF